MAAIHRLLCTHCTFGGSELEPCTADNAAKVLGYSVRRSSLPEPDRGPLRTTFRAVERLLSYDLPKDTPPVRKESLTAETAPNRLIFMPNLAGWQAAAHVSYRTRDTHGRVGSYFADVIAARLDRDTRPWCQLEILKLWSASNGGSLQSAWWCDSEESLAQRDGDGRWKPSDVTALAELRGDAGPFIDDRLLYQFLTLEPGNAAHDSGQIVPARWWSMPALQRRDLLAALLNATIQSRKSGGRENAILAAEPAVAAVLFYGVFRLLPPRLREGIGFSTYEAFPERPLTPLVATTFLDGEVSNSDLSPELMGRGFACNTFRDVAKFGRTQPIAADGFVRRAIDLALASDGWDRLDGFLTSIDALPRPDFRNLDELARIDAFLTKYLTSSHQLDDVTPEPPVSPGSEGEKYRRIRFCKLIRGIGGNPTAKLPHNIVRKAIDWFGEEFPKQWDSDGALASALRARMPENENELVGVFESMTASRTVSPAFIGEAVVRVALASIPQTLPSSYVKFVSHDRSKSGTRGGAVADSATLVQPVLERLAAEHRQDLIEAADGSLIEPILEAITAWEKKQPGRWRDLGLPLLPLVEHELRASHTKKQAEFLVRHNALAKVLNQCAVPPALSEVIDKFFSCILRLNKTKSRSLPPGELLSADGHSRTESLGRWLGCVEPHNKRCYQEHLAAWKTVHEVILTLRSPAEKAGWYSKCPEDLSRFAEACKVLWRDNPVPGKELAQRLGIFLAKSMDGLKVSSKPARKAIVRWLAASLPDDFNGADISDLFLRDEVVGSTRFGLGRQQNWIKWIYAGVGASVTLAAVVIAVLLARRPDLAPQPDETSTAHKETSERSEAKQTKAETPQAPKVSKSSQVTGQAIAAVEGTPSPDPAPPAPESTLTPQSINLRASLDSGAIKVSWDKDVVAGAQLTLNVFIPAEDIEKPLPPEPIAQADIVAGSVRWPIKDKNVFGDYFFQLAAHPKDSPSIESVKVEVPISQPPEPQIESVRLVVAKDGKPALSLKFKAPSTSDLTKYGTCMAVLSMRDGSETRAVPFSDSLSLPLPDRNLTPTRLLDGKSPLKLHLKTDLGDSSACDVQGFVPEGGLEAEVKDRLARKQSEGVTHVCALEETFQMGKHTSLLDLPWWFVESETKEFDLDLLPSGKPVTTDTEDPEAIRLNRSQSNPMQWVCKSGTARLGFFEVVYPNPWKPELCFKADASIGEGAAERVEQAYSRLCTYKLCFLHHHKPFSTAQLMNPSLNGPLLITLPREPNEDELSSMVASCAIPSALAKLRSQLHPVLVAHAADEQVASGMAIDLQSPEEAFVAKLCASQAETGIEADVSLIPNRAETLRISAWKWSKAPSREKDSKIAEVPAAEGEPVSPRLLRDVGERNNQRKEVEQKVSLLKQEHAKETDEKKKSKKATELKKAETRWDKLVDDQKLNEDHLFLPCYKLFDALVGNEIKISNWRLTWDVKSTTATTNIAIPPDVSGGFTVVGVVGTDAGQPPVKFEAEKKK
jgi:hypothetical protein